MDDESRGRWLHAIGKHIALYQQTHVGTHLWATRKIHPEVDLLLRLRSQGRVTRTRLFAFARECGIAPPDVPSSMEFYEAAQLIELERRDDGTVAGAREQIFTEPAVFRTAAARFDQMEPDPPERALVPALELLSRLPLTAEEVADRLDADGHTADAVGTALEVAESLSLLQARDVPDFNARLLYNEYLWGHKIDQVERVLGGLGDRDTGDLLGLMAEVRGTQGIPTDGLTAAPPHLVEMASRTGILDAIEITTASGRRKTFAFSPQFHGLRPSGRAEASLLGISDQVKLTVASIQYGMKYSEDFRLDRPVAFLNKLVNTGEAGDATPIGRDYVLVERQGILRTEPTTGNRAKFVVVKIDVVRAARDALANAMGDTGTDSSARFLAEQDEYLSPESVRVQLARKPGSSAALETMHITAIREHAQRGRWL